MHPILFKIGFLTIYSYGVCLAFAFITAIVFSSYEAKRQKIDKNIIIDLGFYVLISGIIGARLLYIFCNLKDYIANPIEIIMIQHGGLIFYGGLIVAILVGIFFLKKKKLPVLKIIDIVIPSVSLAHMIGRIGCFLNGCCYGRPTNLPCGIVFPEETYSTMMYKNTPVHPSQLYEVIVNLIIFIILLIIRKNKKFDGQVLGFYIFLYGIGRFLVEMTRGDNSINLSLFNLSQRISILLVITGIVFLVKLKKSK